MRHSSASMIQFIQVLMVGLINVPTSLFLSHAGEERKRTVLCSGFRGGGLGQRKETDPAVSGPHHEEKEGERDK